MPVLRGRLSHPPSQGGFLVRGCFWKPGRLESRAGGKGHSRRIKQATETLGICRDAGLQEGARSVSREADSKEGQPRPGAPQGLTQDLYLFVQRASLIQNKGMSAGRRVLKL